MKPWDAGAALARAGRPLPTNEVLESDWAYTRLESCAFSLGYLEVMCGGFSIDTRVSIERACKIGDSATRDNAQMNIQMRGNRA